MNTVKLRIGTGYVLAAEDSLVQAKKLEAILSKNDIKFVICKNGEEAYAQALIEKPTLVISDIIMPGMNGYEFCEKLKSEKSTKHIPVILLTSLQDPHDIIKGLQAGADNFISKPYDENFLLNRMNYLLENINIIDDFSDHDKVSLLFENVKYEINSDKKQIIDLLLSVYEAAILRNNELLSIKNQLEEANSSLQQANEDLSSFAHTVSHDLKSPLTAIMGFSRLLIENQRCQCCKTEFSYMDAVHKSSGLMLNLINDLLNFAKSNKVEVQKKDINLSQIVSEKMIEVRMRIPNQELALHISPEIYVFADPNLMNIVFDNLLGNALKYSHKKEISEISFGKIEQFGKNIYFVKDNGAGFDISKSDKLFQPFQRLHNSSEFKGTGVGLSTVKRIIERHGGQIWAESEIGIGSIFYFTLG